MRINHQTKIRDQILNFLSLIKRKSSIYFIRYATFTHSLFQNTRLSISSIQDSKICIIIVTHSHFINLISHSISLFIIRIRSIYSNFATLFFFRIYVFFYLFPILTNQTIGRIHNITSRTIIPL